jgi:hypothetical protein
MHNTFFYLFSKNSNTIKFKTVKDGHLVLKNYQTKYGSGDN